MIQENQLKIWSINFLRSKKSKFKDPNTIIKVVLSKKNKKASIRK